MIEQKIILEILHSPVGVMMAIMAGGFIAYFIAKYAKNEMACFLAGLGVTVGLTIGIVFPMGDPEFTIIYRIVGFAFAAVMARKQTLLLKE